ncbi:MAG TPA: galactosyltransferase-related protein, partial [Thermoanaerobaculia bacterium]|nr:galactosyltransferase-related protein [Thermoanaerobaculia bacterium]
KGVRCEWKWTSDLHLCRVWPRTGLALMRRAFRDFPVRLSDSPAISEAFQVSFVIGHRGVERLPHLLMTLRSIAGQSGVDLECIVVEQSTVPEIRDEIPAWVRYVHTPAASGLPYCRAWAFNAGAGVARGQILVLHDNDMLVPERYAAEVVGRISKGAAFVDAKRFNFYLSEEDSRRILQTGVVQLDRPPQAIVQNLKGASVAATRTAYESIGGFDELFVGWGGEDNDFWDRARTMAVDEFGTLPLIHLWHPSQPEKAIGETAPAVSRYREIERIPPADRIAELRRRRQGSLERPWTGE